MQALNTNVENICIFRLSAIGDVCNTIPFLRTLQKTYPSAKITWIIGKIEYSLISDIDNVEFIVYDKKLGRKANRALKKTLAGRKFDILFMLQAALRASIASMSIQADLKLGFDKQRAKDFQWIFSNRRISAKKNRHVLDSFFDFLEAIGITQRHLNWDIPIREEDTHFAKQTINEKTTFLISPCSSDRKNNFRNWSVKNYAALCNDLLKQGRQVILTGAPAKREIDYAANIEALAQHKNLLNLSGKTSLRQLFALISEVNCVIAPDSGPIHMANATHTPCIGLYASSNTFRTGPYNYQSLVVNKYPEAVEKFLGKNVADIRWGQRVRNAEVMDMITLEDVLKRVSLIKF